MEQKRISITVVYFPLFGIVYSQKLIPGLIWFHASFVTQCEVDNAKCEGDKNIR